MAGENWGQMLNFLARKGKNVTDGVLANVVIAVSTVYVVIVNM